MSLIMRVVLAVWLLVTPAAALTLDIRQFGALPNDGVDDTVRIRNAIEAVNNQGGGVVFFPAGTWELRNLPLLAQSDGNGGFGAPLLTRPPVRLTLHGVGAATILKRRRQGTSPTDQGRLLTAGWATDLVFQDFAVDMNGLAKYGGAAFYGCTRCTIQRTSWTDSAPPLYTGTADRYGLVFGFTTQLHRDVRILRNTFRHLGVEVDNVDGATIADNVSTLAASTTAFGTFALYSNKTARNLTFARNLIINPRKAGILVGWDRVVSNTLLENVQMLENTVHYTLPQKPTVALRFGVGDNSQPTVGNVMRNVLVQGNTVVTDPAVLPNTVALIFGNNSRIANVMWAGVTVRDNVLESPVNRLFVRVNPGAVGSTIVVTNNVWVGLP